MIGSEMRTASVSFNDEIDSVGRLEIQQKGYQPQKDKILTLFPTWLGKRSILDYLSLKSNKIINK